MLYQVEIADILKIFKSIKSLVKMKSLSFILQKKTHGLFGQPNSFSHSLFSYLKYAFYLPKKFLNLVTVSFISVCSIWIFLKVSYVASSYNILFLKVFKCKENLK